MTTNVHQEIDLAAAPHRIFEALMDSTQHAAFTDGGATSIARDPGGAFSCHGGKIEGRNVDVVKDRRIVQAWRVANWDPGVYSIVRIELHAEGKGTKLVLDHTGIPEGQAEHLAAGWNARYWEPLARWLG